MLLVELATSLCTFFQYNRLIFYSKMHKYHAVLIFLLLEEEEKLDTWEHSHYSKELYSTVLDEDGKSIKANNIP